VAQLGFILTGGPSFGALHPSTAMMAPEVTDAENVGGGASARYRRGASAKARRRARSGDVGKVVEFHLVLITQG